MAFIILVIMSAGVIPMLIYPALLYLLDRYEREPLPLIAATFLWGMIPAALFAIITQIVFDIPLSIFFVEGNLTYQFISASIIAPVTEEAFKGLALLAIYLLIRKEFDSLFDGILYGSLVGFGFAAIENILYFSAETDSIGSLLFLIFLRAFLFGLNHAFYTSFTGIGFAVARLSPNKFTKFSAPLIGLIAAMLAHGLHNTGAILASQAFGLIFLTILIDWTGVLFVLVVIILSIRRERSWIIKQLREEVALGTVTAEQYAIVCSSRQRTALRMKLLTSGKLHAWSQRGRFHQTCTELAFKKHQNQRAGELGATVALIDKLRAQAADLSSRV